MSSCVDTPEGISSYQRRPNAWDGERLWRSQALRRRKSETAAQGHWIMTTAFCASAGQYGQATRHLFLEQLEEELD